MDVNTLDKKIAMRGRVSEGEHNGLDRKLGMMKGKQMDV